MLEKIAGKKYNYNINASSGGYEMQVALDLPEKIAKRYTKAELKKMIQESVKNKEEVRKKEPEGLLAIVGKWQDSEKLAKHVDEAYKSRSKDKARNVSL